MLKVEFLEVSSGTKVHFAVGENFERAIGETELNPQGKILEIGFPNSIYLSVEHLPTSTGTFKFEFWY